MYLQMIDFLYKLKNYFKNLNCYCICSEKKSADNLKPNQRKNAPSGQNNAFSMECTNWYLHIDQHVTQCILITHIGVRKFS